MSTRLTIETRIRTELQESTAGFWTNAELEAWMDEANADIVRATKQESTATITCVAATESYALPADFYLARRVELQSTAGSATNWFQVLPYSIDLRRPGDPINTATLTGSPTGFYIFNNKLYFVPIPDQAYSGTLYYYKNATAFTGDSDSPSYPEGASVARVDRAILLYTCAMALRKRQDGAYITYASDYNSLLTAIIADAAERGNDAPLQVFDDWANY